MIHGSLGPVTRPLLHPSVTGLLFSLLKTGVSHLSLLEMKRTVTPLYIGNSRNIYILDLRRLSFFGKKGKWDPFLFISLYSTVSNLRWFSTLKWNCNSKSWSCGVWGLTKVWKDTGDRTRTFLSSPFTLYGSPTFSDLSSSVRSDGPLSPNPTLTHKVLFSWTEGSPGECRTPPGKRTRYRVTFLTNPRRRQNAVLWNPLVLVVPRRTRSHVRRPLSTLKTTYSLIYQPWSEWVTFTRGSTMTLQPDPQRGPCLFRSLIYHVTSLSVVSFFGTDLR